jgi:hypothetical protein
MLAASQPQLRVFFQAQRQHSCWLPCHFAADWMWISGSVCQHSDRGEPEPSTTGSIYNIYVPIWIRFSLRSPSLASWNSQPDHWLPFVKDHYLRVWRDYLARQLAPGAVIETIEVFAARQGISPTEFQELLESEERMEQEIFIHLPRGVLSAYRERVVDASFQLLTSYLGQSRRQTIHKNSKAMEADIIQEWALKLNESRHSAVKTDDYFRRPDQGIWHF